MADKTLITKPLAAAMGIALASALATATTVVADDNPFAIADLDSGYMLAAHQAGDDGQSGDKGGEGSCGEKGKEGSCGEKGKEGSCGEKGKEGS